MRRSAPAPQRNLCNNKNNNSDETRLEQLTRRYHYTLQLEE
jgi:hypothetical protein